MIKTFFTNEDLNKVEIVIDNAISNISIADYKDISNVLISVLDFEASAMEISRLLFSFDKYGFKLIEKYNKDVMSHISYKARNRRPEEIIEYSNKKTKITGEDYDLSLSSPRNFK